MFVCHDLKRNPCNAVIAGVCGGIADYFDVSPTLVRFTYIMLSLCSVAFPGILVYLILWILIPQRPCYCGEHCCCCD